MSEQKYICSGSKLITIADAIRSKSKTTGTYTLDQMATAITGMQVDGIRVNTVGEGDYTQGYYADAACTVPLTESSLYALLPDGDVYLKKCIYGQWDSAPDSNVAAAIAAAQAGEVDLSTIWSVGDTRKVQLSAMAATGVGESHVAQEVEVVLMDFQQLYDYTDGSGKCKVIWGLKNGLANGTTGEYGYMNSSNNTGGWDACKRRTWCNEVFYKSLPEWMQAATRQVNVITASGSSSSTATSADYCFLPAEKEIFGSNAYASSTAESSLKQWTWYATSGNRTKKCGANGSASDWWERSPSSGSSYGFCCVNSDGGAYSTPASNTNLLAPSGCF